MKKRNYKKLGSRILISLVSSLLVGIVVELLAKKWCMDITITSALCYSGGFFISTLYKNVFMRKHFGEIISISLFMLIVATVATTVLKGWCDVVVTSALYYGGGTFIGTSYVNIVSREKE